jgi:O-antigen/teichoic acid export membrane protein
MTRLDSSRLRHNVVLNLLGHGIPLLAALAAVPLLIRGLGTERFGIVALAWALVTMVGLLDLGLGRAVTQLVAAALGRSEEHRVGALMGNACVVTAGLGLAFGAALFLGSSLLVEHVLQVPDWLVREAATAIRILSLAVPAAMIGNSLRGVLEAYQWFVPLTLVRASLGTLLLLAPIAAMQVSPTLEPVMWAIVVVRWLALAVLLALVRRATPARWTPVAIELRSMVTMGGWMTVSNAMAFLMLYADRLVIGSLLSLEAVTWYAAPAEVIQRLAIVPAAMMGVLFPAFSQLLVEDRDAARGVYRRSRPTILALLLPPVVVLAVFAKPLLTAWVGPEIAARSALVAAILAVGGLIHGLAQPPFHLLQAAGRPDIPARLHLVEAPLYVGYLLWLTTHFGINGTAAAWLLRVSISAVALHWLARRFVLDQPGSAQDPSEAVR